MDSSCLSCSVEYNMIQRVISQRKPGDVRTAYFHDMLCSGQQVMVDLVYECFRISVTTFFRSWNFDTLLHHVEFKVFFLNSIHCCFIEGDKPIRSITDFPTKFISHTHSCRDEHRNFLNKNKPSKLYQALKLLFELKYFGLYKHILNYKFIILTTA